MKMTKFKMPKFDKAAEADMHNEGVANAGEAKLNYATAPAATTVGTLYGIGKLPRNGLKRWDQARARWHSGDL